MLPIKITGTIIISCRHETVRKINCRLCVQLLLQNQPDRPRLLQGAPPTIQYEQLVKHISPSGTAAHIDPASLQFGQQPTDHMVSIKSSNGRWGVPEIVPFGDLPMHPFNSTLHYAVQCYEGLKAYKNEKGQIRIFRPECNMMRFKISSKKIALPDFDGHELQKII